MKVNSVNDNENHAYSTNIAHILTFIYIYTHTVSYMHIEVESYFHNLPTQPAASQRDHHSYMKFMLSSKLTQWSQKLIYLLKYRSGPGCSKLTTSFINVSLKFQTLISQICQYFLLKKCEKALHCRSFSHICNKKYYCIWL